jgi:hypothetical protein
MARVVLGYTMGSYGHGTDGRVFASQPVPLYLGKMTHIVLLQENGTFGLIINGKLRQKELGISGDNLYGLNLPLSEFYRMTYHKPYYYAHTFMEFGRSSYSIKDKEPGYVYEEIRFRPRGFQEYHMSLAY